MSKISPRKKPKKPIEVKSNRLGISIQRRLEIGAEVNALAESDNLHLKDATIAVAERHGLTPAQVFNFRRIYMTGKIPWQKQKRKEAKPKS